VERAVGGEHAVAGDDDRDRVAPERAADGLGGAGLAERRRDLAVGAGLPRRDRARDVVDAAVELRDVIEVERDRGEVVRLAGEQAGDRVDRRRDGGRRRGLDGVGKRAGDPPARRRVVAAGQLRGDDPALAPRDRAAAERRVEEGVSVHAHRTYQRRRA
jgi:hypothetical protein